LHVNENFEAMPNGDTVGMALSLFETVKTAGLQAMKAIYGLFLFARAAAGAH
jgi:hypothetical protein